MKLTPLTLKLTENIQYYSFKHNEKIDTIIK